jgi:hypothetical protein
MSICFTCEKFCIKVDRCPRCKAIRCNNCGIEHENRIYCKYHTPKSWQQEAVIKNVESSINSLNEAIKLSKRLNWEHEKLAEALNIILTHQDDLLAQGQI